MKFNDIKEEQWSEWKPYIDTCLLPVTGLTGREGPIEVTQALEKLRDAMELIELPFKGRVVTYPAYHYTSEQAGDGVNTVIKQLKASGFSYIIVMTAQAGLQLDVPAADLVIQPEHDSSLSQQQCRQLVQSLWTMKAK